MHTPCHIHYATIFPFNYTIMLRSVRNRKFIFYTKIRVKIRKFIANIFSSIMISEHFNFVISLVFTKALKCMKFLKHFDLLLRK